MRRGKNKKKKSMGELILKCFGGRLVFLATSVTTDICTTAIIYEAVNQEMRLFSFAVEPLL